MAKKISKSKAKKWADKFKRDGKGSRSVNFSSEDVKGILEQGGCKGLRIYNAYDEDTKKFTMFLVGTDADGNNLLPTSLERTDEAYFIQNEGKPCPPQCPTNDL